MNDLIIWIADALGVKRKVAPADHSHSQSESWLSTIIGGIEVELDGKASLDALQGLENIVQGLEDSKADIDHTHTKSEITDFAHTHTKSEITDFAHLHSIADVTGLQVLLDGLRDDVDNMDGILGQITVALEGKAPLNHLHDIFDVNGLSTRLEDIDTELDGKADTAHTHIISNIVGLQGALDGKLSGDVTNISLGEEDKFLIEEYNAGQLYLLDNEFSKQLNNLIDSRTGNVYYHLDSGTLTKRYILIRFYHFGVGSIEDAFVEVVGAWE